MQLPDPARWKLIRPLLDEALDREGAERAAFIAGIADESLRADVERMVRNQDRTAVFDQPVAALAGSVIAQSRSRDWDREQIGRRLGAFRLERLVGAGGMGTVYAASRVDGRFEQTVAIKLVLSAHPGLRDRFQREQRIVAGLRHPNIAQLLDGGESDDGIPYFAMEYVEGVPITEYVVNNGLDERGIVKLILKVAAALVYAHRQLIVHRDIKPSNILVTADGHPKLLDFGIAKLVGGDEQKLTAQRVGPMTPEYAAPEQYRGQAITVATDVYQLGVLIYRLIAGRLPYDANPNDSLAWAKALIERDPIPLFHTRTSNSRATHNTGNSGQAPSGPISAHAGTTNPRQVRRTMFALDLEAIVMKALSKSPEARYPSVEAMMVDLEAVLDERPVSARRQTLMRRAWRVAARHRLSATIGVLAVLALIGTTGFALYQASLARAAEREARHEAARARRTIDFVAEMFRVVDPAENRAERLTADDMLTSAGERIAQIRDDAGMRADLGLIIARTFDSMGESAAAMQHYQAAIDTMVATTPLPRAALAMAYARGARTAAMAGRVAQARSWIHAFDGLGLAVDPEHLHTHAIRAVAAARLARVEARVDDAIGEILRAIEFYEAMPDRPAGEYAVAVHLHSILLFSRNDLSEARLEAERAKTLFRALPQSESFRIDYVDITVAAILREQGQLDSALALLQKNDQRFRQIAGNESTLVGHNLFDLAIVELVQARDDLAFPHLWETAEIFEKRYGPESSWRWDAMHRALWSALRLGLDGQVLELGYPMLRLAEQEAPPDLSHLGYIYGAVAAAELRLGHIDRAEAAINGARESLLGVESTGSLYRADLYLVEAELAAERGDAEAVREALDGAAGQITERLTRFEAGRQLQDRYKATRMRLLVSSEPEPSP